MTTLSTRSIRSFNNLATSFVSQFTPNKVKRLEVVDLFDIRQAKGESLKNYLARFNNAIVQHRGTIATISGGSIATARVSSSGRRRTRDVLTLQARGDATPFSVITFDEKDMKYMPSWLDEPIVVSVIAIEYKIERILID
ncbi:hypothetical protein CR513_25660, partial [Mucuna pruriens]